MKLSGSWCSQVSRRRSTRPPAPETSIKAAADGCTQDRSLNYYPPNSPLSPLHRPLERPLISTPPRWRIGDPSRPAGVPLAVPWRWREAEHGGGRQKGERAEDLAVIKGRVTLEQAWGKTWQMTAFPARKGAPARLCRTLGISSSSLTVRVGFCTLCSPTFLSFFPGCSPVCVLLLSPSILCDSLTLSLSLFLPLSEIFFCLLKHLPKRRQTSCEKNGVWLYSNPDYCVLSWNRPSDGAAPWNPWNKINRKHITRCHIYL